MGIAPITNLIPLSIERASASTLEPLPMARVENSARRGDETYTPSRGESEEDAEDSSSSDSDLELTGDTEFQDEDSEDNASSDSDLELSADAEFQDEDAEENSAPDTETDTEPELIGAAELQDEESAASAGDLVPSSSSSSESQISFFA
jgi:hypothetical protein